jgi:hypothetical protein
VPRTSSAGKWNANANDIAAFLGAINLYWSQAGWRAMLYDHLGMTENEAVQLLNGQYAASIGQYDAIQAQALRWRMKRRAASACSSIYSFRVTPT